MTWLPAGALALLAVVLLATPTPGREESLQTEQRRLRETERQLREEREKAAAARQRETSVLAELEETERRLGGSRREVARLDRRIRTVQRDIAGLRGDVAKLQGLQQAQERALARRLRAIYRIHAQGAALPLLLTEADPAERAALIRQLGSLAALDARLIQEYRVTLDRVAERKTREESRRVELAGLRRQAAREQSEVDRDAARRRVLLARVRDERTYHERMVGELSEAARRLGALVAELQARQRRVAKAPVAPRGAPPAVSFGTLRGRLPWPADGRVVMGFGPQVHPRFGTKTFRNGVDIAATEGADVLAVHAGQVVYAGWFKGYGNLVILDHGDEFFTLYAHIGEILVNEGDEVRQGQRVGTVGDTGSLAGPRLYFEVRHQGRPQDPEQWLRQRG